MRRRSFLAGNWKMFKELDEAKEFVLEFLPLVSQVRERQMALAVPFTSLSLVAELAKDSQLIVGAQNCHWDNEGAFTGEISCSMIKTCGASMVLIGHSERRQYFGDTDQIVSRKLAIALYYGLLPIVCLGENLAERESGLAFEVLSRQIKTSLEGLTAADAPKIVLAYEPVWAIGTGRTATDQQAQEAHSYLRARLTDMVGSEAAVQVRILYGGSVKPDNVASLMSQPDIDGVLVGGASLSPQSFAKIVNYLPI
ncbi:MAG: triose-phosphate isomerase [Deltaproteobacteria bacterium]|nr:triose-phosphate isomerase [Deltaproteobacteria bacterium]